MYDMPHAASAYDRLWHAIRTELGHGPDALSRDIDPWEAWQSDDLLLAQTCGLPFRARLYGQVNLVGTPDYGLRDCPQGYYYSYIVRRRGDSRSLRDLARGGTIAFNDPLSQSGWAAPVALLADKGLRPAATMQTGAHLASANAVLDGRADYAAIDAISYMMWDRAEPQVFAGLEAFMRTKPTPGLPLITAQSRDPKPIAQAVTRSIHTMDAADRDILLLKGLVQIPEAIYRAIPIPPMP
ncbi:PhnD/SsuA/transferrin family substrate-binding protein [uncultured Tateyamaria sp.]|uniref:phosphate/phosphite/phosphonate ABC transporter substrate-binding protein n=1 Tax=uncultured Tateyamaria sp. TaxID=455651 RepID=UPI0026200B06|nr:PhnD/SsuA/transferrin family substrate-binding protein [uncultured Tateyamaria sp.]